MHMEAQAELIGSKEDMGDGTMCWSIEESYTSHNQRGLIWIEEATRSQ